MSVACYTAICGGYDDLKSHPDIADVDFVAFTDDPTLASEEWTVRLVAPDGTHPRDQAKQFKLFPHCWLPEYDFTIWVDGSHEILTDRFALDAIAAIDETGIAVYEHPWRSCIYEEAAGSLEEQPEKYQGTPITEQVGSYRAAGHPENWGLYATGTIARYRSPQVAMLMEAWAAEIDRWTYQDQLSLPVVCRRLDMRPATFPLHQIFGNPWTSIHAHNRRD